MEFIYLFITGSVVGLISSFFGIGGGSIMIPILYMLFPKLPAQAIIPVSLGTIFLNTVINNINFYREKLFPGIKTAAAIVIPALAGGFIGAIIVAAIDTATAKKIFGALLVVITAQLFLTKSRKDDNKELRDTPFLIGVTAFLGSIISCITGLGGGIIFVPFFLNIVKLPMKYISPFSNIAMSVATFMGLVPHFFRPIGPTHMPAFIERCFIGHVNLFFIFVLFVGALITSRIGVKYNSKVSPRLKKYCLASLFGLFAIKILMG